MIKNFKIFEYMIFEKFEDIILYHGSNKEFKEFDDTKLSTGDSSELFGKGYYLTDNIEVAKFYAKMITKKEKITHFTDTGIFKTPEPHFTSNAEKHAEKNYKINTFRIKGNIMNSRDYILDDKFLEFLKKLWRKDSFIGKSADKIFDDRVKFMRENKSKIRNYRGELWYILLQCGFRDKRPIIFFIQSVMDFDGLKYETDLEFEGEHGWNYVIYNKSVIEPV
jgi:hypothetical protein